MKLINAVSLRRLLFIFMALLFIGACTDKTVRGSGTADAESQIRNPDNSWPALALLRTGENPLWFELGADGPQLIESPGTAAALPLCPWPHAWFISSMLPWDSSLVMAVNGSGFLVLAPEAESGMAALYQVSDGFWKPYTVGSFFLLDNKPAVLLYRNDFFAGSVPERLQTQVFSLDKSSSVPLSVNVPVFASLASGWEAEILHRGTDGFWYYRAKEKGKTKNETAYFRTRDLALEAESISTGEWRVSLNPEDPANTPLNLAAILEKVVEFGIAGKRNVVRTISPDFENLRIFAAGDSSAENLSNLYAYCRQSGDPIALVIAQDGRGVYSRGTAAKPFSLPGLPDGFCYTGLAVFSDIRAASWEEQLEASIGAAGFMVVNISAWQYFK
jgi:hypothetical protein